MPLNFAAETEVPVDRSRAEISTMIMRWGVSKFGTMQTTEREQIAFERDGRRYRFELINPSFDHPWVCKTLTGKPRPEHSRPAAYQQLRRILWRTLALSIKARLAEIEMGMTSFELAFLAETILPTGRTVAEETAEPIRLAYEGKTVPLLQHF